MLDRINAISFLFVMQKKLDDTRPFALVINKLVIISNV
jgi:hypothetical protein